MSKRNDSLLLKILLMDNIMAIQLVLMAPALSVSAKKPWLCAIVLVVLFASCFTGLYFLSPKLQGKLLKIAKFLPAPIAAAGAAMFFMSVRDALMCGLTAFLSELILVLINGRISASDIKPTLRIAAECISAGILSMAMLGLRL